MAGFFSPENWYWKPFDYVADAVLLSGMWVLGSIPIVTCGAATTALYDCVAHCVRGGEKDLFGRFFRTYKRELVPSMICFVLWMGILLGCRQGIKLAAGFLPNTNGGAMVVAGLFFLLSVVAGIFAWVLPLLSRFTFSIGNLNRMAVKLACSHIFRTILAGVAAVAAVEICRRTWYPMMVVPEIVAVIWAALMEPIFKKYMTEEERMAVEKPKEDENDLL